MSSHRALPLLLGFLLALLVRRALAGGALLTDGATDTGPYSAACYALMYAGEPAAAIAELTRAELALRRVRVADAAAALMLPLYQG